MADEFNKEIKSNRLLQSLRYTAAAQDNQEAFTRVLDLNATEVYTQQQYIPSSSLPFNDNSGHLKFITASIDGAETNIAQYYFEVSCSKSSRVFGGGKSEVWFVISGSGFSPNPVAGIGSTIIEGLQQTNWLSNKYMTASLALATADDATPGYNVRIKVNGTNVSSQDYQFDYKTGVLQFVSNTKSPATTDAVTITGYRYVGKTLANETFGGSSSGGSGIFAATGSIQSTTNNLEITGSLLASGSVVDFSKALAVSSSNLNSTNITTNTLTATTITGVSNATFESASIDHLTVNTIISASTIITSGSNTFGDDTTDTQTLIGRVIMTGSAEITGSLGVTGTLSIQGIANVSQSIANAAKTGTGGQSGIFTKVGATNIFNATSSLQITGSTLQRSPYTATGANITSSNAGTGGTFNNYALVVSESVWHRNANVGVPASNAWGSSGLAGSYFSNFDQNTNISEVLRFIAGLLSSSAPSSIPNTQTYNNITAAQGGTQTGTVASLLPGYVPLNFTDQTTTYLNSKGFANTGEVLFNGISTIYRYPDAGTTVYNRKYSSAAGGSTSVSSSIDDELFGLGTIGLEFAVSGTLNWFFSSGSNQAVTSVSQSENLLTKTGTGTSNGLTIGNIQTANPAVIPNEFQDGKFANIFEAEISDISSGLDFETTGSVGYYHLSSSIKIRSGSAASGAKFSPAKTDKFKVFYVPLKELNANIDIDSPQNLTLSQAVSSSTLITSRSFSGAPYIQTGEWKIKNSTAGVFNPLYAGNTTQVVHMTKTGDSDSIINLSHDNAANNTLTISGGSISTTGSVFTSAGVIKNTGTPAINDTVKMSGSLFLVASSGVTNVVQNNGTDNNLDDLDFDIATSAKSRSGSALTLRTDNFQYFVPGTFDQPFASGSMAYYGRAQGYDPATATGTTETFLGEDFRRKLNDALLSVTSADAYGTTYSDGLVDPAIDLQIKPGFLVKPGGTYKYWLPTSGTSIYRYYAREFDTGGATYSSMTINIDGKTDLKKWSNTSEDGVAVGVLLASGTAGGNKTLIDLADYIGSDQTNVSPTAGLNPFGVNIDIFSNSQSSNATIPNYEISMNPGKRATLNASNRIYQLIIRYRGDQAPVTQITVAYQS
jgi:hypothetical protein